MPERQARAEKRMIDDPIDHAMVEAIKPIGHVTDKQMLAACAGTPALLAAVHRLGIAWCRALRCPCRARSRRKAQPR